jgi:hypothetical protein
MFANVGPADYNYDETISTLRLIIIIIIIFIFPSAILPFFPSVSYFPLLPLVKPLLVSHWLKLLQVCQPGQEHQEQGEDQRGPQGRAHEAVPEGD